MCARSDASGESEETSVCAHVWFGMRALTWNMFRVCEVCVCAGFGMRAPTWNMFRVCKVCVCSWFGMRAPTWNMFRVCACWVWYACTHLEYWYFAAVRVGKDPSVLPQSQTQILQHLYKNKTS